MTAAAPSAIDTRAYTEVWARLDVGRGLAVGAVAVVGLDLADVPFFRRERRVLGFCDLTLLWRGAGRRIH